MSRRRGSPQGPKARVGWVLLLALPAGCLTWIWTGDWRWAGTGVVLVVVGLGFLAAATPEATDPS